MNYESLKNMAEEAVREAGKIMLTQVFDKKHIIVKGPANYVTEVDFKVQEFLTGRLDEIIPGSNIITEESEKNKFIFDKTTWILDPVDGTTNLMYGYHHSAVSLALLLEGMPYLGIIYNPFLDEIFTAEHGKGALLNGRAITVSCSKALSESVISFGTTPYDKSKSKKTFEAVERIFSGGRDVRRSGSAALDIAYVACGRTEGFFELMLQPWDFAAGVIILEEAGGKATNMEGEKLDMLSAGSIIATNGYIHGELKEILCQTEMRDSVNKP